MKNSRGVTEKNSLLNENENNHSISLNPDKNLGIAFGSYPVFNMSE